MSKDGWSGLLVLNGRFDISPIYKVMLADQAGDYSIAHGDTNKGSMEYKNVEAGTDQQELIAQLSLKMPIAPFTMLLIGEPAITTHIPTRKTTVSVWAQGHIQKGFGVPADLLIQLNKTPIPQKLNYTRLIRERVIAPLVGKYSMCLGYFSTRPRVILATQNMELYTWLVYYNGVYMFVWNTDQQFIERVNESLQDERRNEVFALPINLDNRSMIVIHPMYWITKFNKVLRMVNSRNAPLLVISYMSNYLLRQTITRAEAYYDLSSIEN